MLKFATVGPARIADKRVVAKAAALMCCRDIRPFSIVDGEGFLKLADALIDVGVRSKTTIDTRSLLPTGNTVKNNIIVFANETKEKLKKICSSHIKTGVGAEFAVDLWTDSVKKYSFMSVTMHYIDEYYNLNYRTLQVRHYKATLHSAEAVLSFLMLV